MAVATEETVQDSNGADPAGRSPTPEAVNILARGLKTALYAETLYGNLCLVFTDSHFANVFGTGCETRARRRRRSWM